MFSISSYTKKFQKQIHRSFECNLIPGTSYRSDKQIHFSNNQFTNGVLTWFNCNSSFRNLQIIRSDLRFCNTFQFVKYSAPKKFFSLLAVKNEVNELLPVNSSFICSCQIKVQQLPLAVFHGSTI